MVHHPAIVAATGDANTCQAVFFRPLKEPAGHRVQLWNVK